jgi:DNA-binding IscR family transcriptional regulator
VRRNSQLSGVLHVLLHMAELSSSVTSEALARTMNTNPVVVRRIMAGLRDKGYVQSEKGHGGGWRIACNLSTLTLRDIYFALGRPALFAIGNRTETPGCPVEKAVNAALNPLFQQVEDLLISRLGEVTLAMLSAHFRKHMMGRRSLKSEKCHRS